MFKIVKNENAKNKAFEPQFNKLMLDNTWFLDEAPLMYNDENLEAILRFCILTGVIEACEKAHKFLFRVIDRKNKKLIKLAIDCVLNPDYTKNEKGETPLIYCAREKYAWVVKKLLEAGADPYAVDDENKDAMDYAVENCDIKTAAYLVLAGYDIDDIPRTDAFFKDAVLREAKKEEASFKKEDF